jgi:hypothetical protein
MGILVRYKNEIFSIVQNHELDDLIATNKIIAFRRSNGWVDLSKGPIRGKGSPKGYTGSERRGRGTEELIHVP